MNTKLVVFDFDGTLADTSTNIVNVMQHIMLQLKLEVKDAKSCASTIGLPLKSCFQSLYPTLDDAMLERCVEAYRQYFSAHIQHLIPDTFPHVEATLAALQQAGIQMAIASSRTTTSLRNFVAAMHLDPYISMVVGCEDVAHPKPAPDAVVSILNTLNISNENTIVVGDMPVDILMGQSAGTATCAVTYGNASPEQLLATHPNFIINDLAQLLNILKIKLLANI